ncbi:MAG TPA: hypothetical protein VK936_01805 [Longimicrobiales bacterium]|nr:hypothetical protein [Longimicrobiales bacterium]
MMHTRLCTLPALLAVMFAATSALTAVPTPAAAQEACTYDTCGLRIRAPSFSAPRAIVRGTDGTEVARLGLMEPAIAPLVQLSDSAVAHARVYDVLNDRGSIITIVGTVLSIGAPIIFRDTGQKIGFAVAGIGITVYGGMVSNQAQEALSRAIWWYNRELAGRPNP